MIGIVVTYCGEIDLLPHALDSIIGQSVPPESVVVVNDAHPVSAESVARSYGFDYIKNAVNLGLAESRNVGIDYLPTEFYLPLDADDKLTPHCIETYLQYVSQDYYCYSDMYLWQNGHVSHWKAKPFDITSLLNYNYISATSCIPKNAWYTCGGYDSEFSELGGWEDWAMWLKMYQHGITGKHIPQPLFYRRIRHDSMVKRLDKDILKGLLRDKFPDLYGEIDA